MEALSQKLEVLERFSLLHFKDLSEIYFSVKFQLKILIRTYLKIAHKNGVFCIFFIFAFFEKKVFFRKNFVEFEV